MPTPETAASGPRAKAPAKTPKQVEEEQQAADLQAALDSHTSLAEALVWVAGKITEVPKRGFNNHFGYTYATKDDMIDVLKPLLAEAGLVVVPHHVSTERSEPDAKGMVDLVVTWQMHVVHRSGSLMVVPWESESMDNQDKGFGKAATSAMKMFYQQLFDIPSGDADIEHDSNSATNRAGGERPAAQSKGRGSRVFTKDLLDYQKEHNLSKTQVDWALAKVGAAPGTRYNAISDEQKPVVMAALQVVVAERSKRDPDTGEPLATPPPDADTSQPLDDPGPSGDWASDEDIPF